MRRTTAATLLLLAACSTKPGALDHHFLTPASDWFVEPSQLGRAAEPFELAVGGGTLAGWFLPGKDSGGRTVLLMHDGRTNASQLFPWYGFLCDAGFNVCAYDYCGFGRSKGEPGLRSAYYDAPAMVDWLARHAGVDAAKIAWFGTDIGAAIAMRTATVRGGCAALVLEDVPSLRDRLRETTATGEAASSTLAVGFAEFVHAPEDSEPADNAPKLTMPSLWLTGADRPRDQLRATLRAYVEMGGDKQLWLLPGTGRAPHGMLTHDGEYQRAIARFLRSALAGAPERIAVDCQPSAVTENGTQWYEIALDRRGGDQEPWAVQVAAADAQGGVTMQNTWLEGAHGKLRMKLAAAPGVVAAVRIDDAQRADPGVFARPGTPLSRGGAWYEANAAVFARMREGEPDRAAADAAAAAIAAHDRLEPMPPQLAAELTDVFWRIGRMLTSQPSAEPRALGRVWLRRAVASAPDHPEQHWWPATTPTWGFQHQQEVALAKDLLQKLDGADRAQ
jgi:pimeloyl-ACP methyl ester carboxylesterase